jgi:protein-S-isoprenylcysteine O-methyltransferase Ste14
VPEAAHEIRPLGWRWVWHAAAQVVFLAIPFVAAGTVHWMRGWIWIGLLAFSMAVFLLVVRRRNPGLLRVRLETRFPTERFDQVFVALYIAAALGFFVVAGLDVRLGWTRLSFTWVYVGIALHLAGSAAVTAAGAANPYLDAIVRVQRERGHVVVTSGPYAIVRHPMYSGVVAMFLGWPLVLGSLWAFVPAGCVVLLFVFRAANEERTLRRELPGYEEYTHRTRRRLVPGLW